MPHHRSLSPVYLLVWVPALDGVGEEIVRVAYCRVDVPKSFQMYRVTDHIGQGLYFVNFDLGFV